MMQPGSPSGDLLARLLLLQNLAALIPERGKLLDLVCRGLEDFPGIDRVRFISDCEHECGEEEGSLRIPIRYGDDCFGFILAELIDPPAFEAYSPFVENMVNMIGVIIANRQHEARMTLERDQFFELSTDLLCITGTDGYFKALNPRWKETLDWSNEELLARPFFDFIHPEDVAPTQKQLQRLEAGETVLLFKNRYVCRDGSYRWLEWTASAEKGSFYASARDVTKSMKTQKALEESERRFHAVFDHAFQLTGILSPDGILLESNRTAYEFSGVTPADAVGKAFWETLWWRHSVEAKERLRKAVDEARQGASVRFETTHPRVDGSIAAIDFSIKPVRDENAEVELLIAEGRDISELKLIEEQLHQSQKLQAIGELTGGIAHDFNNLLMIISGNIDLLRRHFDGDEKALRFINSVDDASARGAELTNRLLAFSRRQALEPKSVRVDELVLGMEDMLRRSLGESVDISLTFPSELWPSMVDPGQLETALLNLVINSGHAMPNGGKLTIEAANITLEEEYATAHEEVVAGDYVVLSISDTGSGIPADIIGRIFEPFFTTKTEGKGTGLGLSMVFGFIKQSGGHVQIYSELGQGTTVRLYIPRTEADLAVNALAAGGEEELTGREAVLVVEDNDFVRDVAVIFLEEAGYRVYQALDAPEALRMLGELPRIDLLFTDVVLPKGMHGAELASAVKTRWPDTRVLYTTGYSENAILHRGKLDSGVQLISKPYQRLDLLRKVREVLRKR